jgi:hypothetical protein
MLWVCMSVRACFRRAAPSTVWLCSLTLYGGCVLGCVCVFVCCVRMCVCVLCVVHT